MKKLLRSMTVCSLGALMLAGCANEATSSGSGDDVLKVVTTTDVYANIVKEVAGDQVEVTSLISSTSQDPHSYEATAADRLTVKDADLVVLNGGGYDQFLEDMAGKDNPDQKIINAVEVSGLFDEEELKELTEGHSHEEGEEHTHDHAALNEHIWYSFEAMKNVSDTVAKNLRELDAGKADIYTAHADQFENELDTLEKTADGIDGKGMKFIATEPVPNYLLQSAKMEDATPADFSSAIESDSDIAPLTMQEVKEQLADGSVNFLGYNEQTASHQTNEILQTAQDHKIAHASFTETLPEGKSYVDWMKDNISHIKQALEK
ncbi:metal ABC transporter solute-binding protein, Zn/Mn family [uncultured Rothia sp.]|uniref:metal ABC transporter solute-binding protein, Zn/Mn family n=1 Tax=uncultured Rothia sp. TaxID=316088 RepID=UPI00321708C5